MLDIKVIRIIQDAVKQAMKTRNMDADAIIDEILDIDVQRRKITGEDRSKKAEQNADTKANSIAEKRGERYYCSYGAIEKTTMKLKYWIVNFLN